MSEPTDAPPDEADAGLEANLGEVTDQQWLEAHRALIESEAVPLEELAYLYDPERDPDTVTVDDLTVDPDPAESDHG